MEILFLDKVFHKKIWGGNRLKTHFNYDIEDENIGECWTISAHPKGDCKIINETHRDKTLSWLWSNERNIFGDIKGDSFPLLTKIIDAKDDLSVQVHPDDKYAFEFEDGSIGKTECWYIIDCDEGAELIIGHNANSREEMRKMIEQELWDDLLRRVTIKPGDFFYIPAGTIHAIGKGTLLLEIQQSCDITYRVYDYNRLQDGKPRELHIDKGIEATIMPHRDYKIVRNHEELESGFKERLVDGEYFSVERLYVDGELTFNHYDDKFKIISVLDGKGSIDGKEIKKGDHFILPYNYGPCTLTGTLELITTY